MRQHIDSGGAKFHEEQKSFGSSKRSQVVFLMRGYASVDHLAPIAHALLQRGKFDISFLAIDPSYDVSGDTRIQYFVREHGVALVSLLDHLGFKARWVERWRTLLQALWSKWPIGHSLIDHLSMRAITFLRLAVDEVDPTIALTLTGNRPVELLIMDHNSYELSCQIAEEVRGRGGLSISFPHYAFIWANELRVQTMVSRPDRGPDSFVQFRYCDYIVANTERERQAGLIGFADGCEGRIPILGSARFSKQWVRFRDEHIPEKAYNFPTQPAGCLKLVFLCPKRANNVFWDELVRCVRILAAAPEVALCIKAPAQGNLRASAELRGLGLGNVDVVAMEYDTASLVKWADAVLFVETSIFFEALLQQKPLVHLRYLHINRFFFDDWPVMWSVKCRDDLFDVLDQLSADPRYRPYTDEDVRELYAAALNNLDRDPLNETAEFLSALIEQTTKARSA